MCVCLFACAVQIRGTDSLQLGVEGVGVGVCVCQRACLCVVSDVLAYLTNANERSAENNCGISCRFRGAKVTRGAALESGVCARGPRPATQKYARQHTLFGLCVPPQPRDSSSPSPPSSAPLQIACLFQLKTKVHGLLIAVRLVGRRCCQTGF